MRIALLSSLFVLVTSTVSCQPSGPGLPHIRLTDSISCTEVKDQSQSPTCWVFGTNSLFESDRMKIYGDRINLSEMFIARYAYIDKAKKWLETKGKTYYEGGGQFHDVIRVINNYGMVPEEAYRGLPGKELRHDHRNLDTAMRRLARQWLEAGKTTMNNADLKQMNDTLDRYLGKLPTKFTYEGRIFTPKTYAAEFIHFGDDYAELMSFSNLPLNKKCLLDDKYNWAGDSLYNISLNDLQGVVDSALANGWSIGWEGDVTDPGFNAFSGFATEDDIPHKFDEERLVNYKNEKTERDHMLHIVGVGKDEQGKKWYYLKNSWGSWFGHSGYIYMNETYFKLKTVILMVNKKGLPQALKKKMRIQ